MFKKILLCLVFIISLPFSPCHSMDNMDFSGTRSLPLKIEGEHLKEIFEKKSCTFDNKKYSPWALDQNGTLKIYTNTELFEERKNNIKNFYALKVNDSECKKIEEICNKVSDLNEYLKARHNFGKKENKKRIGKIGEVDHN